MYRLPFIIILLLAMGSLQAQSPHGEHLKLDCGTCHSPNGWDIPLDSNLFDHSSTSFALEGTHALADCKSCHTALVFENTPNDCISCHKDMHNMTVGNDCARCHNSGSWLVNDIPEIHEQNGFPLAGAHSMISCVDCHKSETNLRFDRLGNECVNCHLSDYQQTTQPNHLTAQFSTECTLCHSITSTSWDADINHNFFPLTKGHDISDCKQCHLTDNFADASPECISCHNNDFMNAQSPNHKALNFSNECTTCHTTDIGWQPANFATHDNLYFPIYSGKHKNEWNECRDCHSDPNNYTSFTCTTCHQNPETDREHREVNGYSYNSQSCLACHPSGNGDSRFDHNRTQFPLTGAHRSAECISCHSDGFAGTKTDCFACHTADFEATLNPKHIDLKLPEDCASCHTTDPDWTPASFDIHDDFYILKGAHAVIAQNCAECHQGDYQNTPNTCIGCHEQDYSSSINPDHQSLKLGDDCITCHTESSWSPASFDIHDQIFPLTGAHAMIASDCAACHKGQYNNTTNTCAGCHMQEYNSTSNPNHKEVQFNLDCASCHSSSAWSPATFDHDSQFFPIYSGAHNGEWNDCIDCHTSPNNFKEVSCTVCHKGPQTNQEHNGIQGYVYESMACLVCHPNGESMGAFDHSFTNFPLTGAHIGLDCKECHANGYQGTSTECVDCHRTDYNTAANPDHNSINIPTDCASCHTTELGWTPATFDIHNNFYPLNGAHATIASECATCHANGDYKNTPNTCAGCHINDYNITRDPDHKAANISTDCINCHSEGAWSPATFDHNLFYPIEGAHKAVANECAVCHTNSTYQNTPNTCAGCHITDYNNTRNPDHSSAQFPTDCTECHDQKAWNPASFNHDIFYPIKGAHKSIANDCAACHTNGNYSNTPNTCAGCHTNDYNATRNPNHKTAQFPTDCASCHSESSWQPATFNHDAFFPIVGAHKAISNECASCHTNANYSNTPNTCAGCHITDYNNTRDPNHKTAQFPTECIDCHSQTAWEPANFNHDQKYFPIYSGSHRGEWNSCTECHTNSSNYSLFSCIDCHEHSNKSQVDREHKEARNYSYESNACYSCHPRGKGD